MYSRLKVIGTGRRICKFGVDAVSSQARYCILSRTRPSARFFAGRASSRLPPGHSFHSFPVPFQRPALPSPACMEILASSEPCAGLQRAPFPPGDSGLFVSSALRPSLTRASSNDVCVRVSGCIIMPPGFRHDGDGSVGVSGGVVYF